MSEYHRPDAKTMQALKDIANQLRIDSINATNASNSGHPTSCCSAAEIMSVLFFHTMRYDPKFPRHPASDRFVMSKGHACPILYAAWAEAGAFSREDLLKLRKIDSDLEGHPTPNLNFIDVATGSLGQGLGCAAGMAYTGKYFDKADYRVYCLIGDGESAEGSIWEAMSFSSHYKLDNLVAIFDINRLGQSEPAMLQHDMATYEARAKAFGWHTQVVNGHSVEDLCKTLHEAAQTKGKPTCILAKTFKGKGCPETIEDQLNWHGKALGKFAEASIAAMQGCMENKSPSLKPKPIETTVKDVDITNIRLPKAPEYELNEQVATRLAYGKALAKLGDGNDRIVAMDGDTKNSTFSDKFKAAHPDRYVECFIAEQNLVGVAIGCGTRGRTVPFCSTFAAFFTRAFDQIRMGAISQTNVNFAGSHAGISIGEDGPSQMALEDLAMFRSVPGSTVFYPSDAVSCERAVEIAANTKGVCFIRTSRPNVPVIYKKDEPFEAGKAKVVRSSDNDQVTVIGCCVTLVEAMKAADTLAADYNINITIIDPFTLKPFDKDTVLACARKTGGRIITVEDHYEWGGLGDCVAGELSEESGIVVKKLAVKKIPRSGKPDQLMEMFGISANCIVKAVISMVQPSK